MGKKTCAVCADKDGTELDYKPGTGHICWMYHIRKPALGSHSTLQSCKRHEEIKDVALSVVGATASVSTGRVYVHLGCCSDHERPSEELRIEMRDTVSTFMVAGHRCELVFVAA